MEMYPRIIWELVTDPLGHASTLREPLPKPKMYYGSWIRNQDSKKGLYEKKSVIYPSELLYL